MMMLRLRSWPCLAAGLGLVLGAAGPARASLSFGAGSSNVGTVINVAIDDRTEGAITATINGNAVSVLQIGELVTFTVPVPLFVAGPGISASRDLLEANNNNYSDRLLVAGLGGTSLLVSFASDPAITLPGITVFDPLHEDGTSQPLFFATVGGLFGGTTTVNFRVASDVAAVPEGSTIAMAASAVPMGLGFWWRRRRRASA